VCKIQHDKFLGIVVSHISSPSLGNVNFVSSLLYSRLHQATWRASQTTGACEGADPLVLNGLVYKCVLKSDNALFRPAGGGQPECCCGDRQIEAIVYASAPMSASPRQTSIASRRQDKDADPVLRFRDGTMWWLVCAPKWEEGYSSWFTTVQRLPPRLHWVLYSDK